jgi:hypothetical protein
MSDDHLALHVNTHPQHALDLCQRIFVHFAIVVETQTQAGRAVFDMFDILSATHLGDDIQRSLQVIHVWPLSPEQKKRPEAHLPG